jgi:hypothetical protein
LCASLWNNKKCFDTVDARYKHEDAIDNNFTDISATGAYELYPFINRLSDHDAQMLMLNKGQKKKGKGMLYLH